MTIEIPLTKGKVALIDEDDLALVSGHSWYAHESLHKQTWYARAGFWIDGRVRQVYMHRHLMGLTVWDGREVDHWDYDGLNNRRRSNLRIVTHAQNQQHRREWYKGSKSKLILPVDNLRFLSTSVEALVPKG